MRRSSGLTLIELLVAVAIFAIVILLLAQLFNTTRVAYEVNEGVAEERQNVESAAQILKYDLALGGYRGIDGSAESRLFTCTFQFTDGTSGAPDEIRAWYYEDRFVTSAPEVRAVRFYLQSGSLMREINGTATEVISGIEDFQFVEWHQRGNVGVSDFLLVVSPPTSTDASSGLFAGYQLELTFAGGERELVSVGLPNPQIIATSC